jgi:YfiH family protein
MFDKRLKTVNKHIEFGFISKKDLHLESFKDNYTAENISKILKYISGGVKGLSFVKQTHSKICHINAKAIFEGEANINDKVLEGDAHVTKQINTALIILTADCVPIIFYDSEAQVIGIAHAGWRGAFAGIINATIEKMLELGANKKNIVATIGPCIHQKSYEVDEVFYQNFLKDNPKNSKFFISGDRTKHYYFDLPGYCKNKLQNLKLKEVHNVDSDTFSNEDLWYSYRRCTKRGIKSLDGNIVSYIVLLND